MMSSSREVSTRTLVSAGAFAACGAAEAADAAGFTAVTTSSSSAVLA